MEKLELERRRLEDTLKDVTDKLVKSRHQLTMMGGELRQQNEQLSQLSAQLKTSHDDCVDKSEQVFSSWYLHRGGYVIVIVCLSVWLPVKQRAMYKLAIIAFNVLQRNNPMYLRDLLTTHNPSRNLRSSSQHLLSVGYVRTVSSWRCFKHSAAINWNDLPFDIRACDSVNWLIFSTLPLLPSHVSSPCLRLTF